MTDRPVRLRHYPITAQALLLGFQTGNVTEVIDGVPQGADLVDCGYVPERQQFYLTVEHESFDRVPEGHEIPEGEITFEDRTDELGVEE